jgi:hypothetical protein
MTTEINQFDASQAMASVKERIKDAFVSLIPDEQWEQMVKKEVASYFDVKTEGYTRGQSSDFTQDVHRVLKEEVDKRVKEYLQSNFTTVWDQNGLAKCNQKVEEIITKNAGKVLADMIGGSMQTMLYNAGFRG